LVNSIDKQKQIILLIDRKRKLRAKHGRLVKKDFIAANELYKKIERLNKHINKLTGEVSNGNV
jgi:hypothetical protein